MEANVTIKTKGVFNKCLDIEWPPEKFKGYSVFKKDDSFFINCNNKVLAEIDNKQKVFIDKNCSITKDMYNVEIISEEYGKIFISMDIEKSNSKTFVFNISLNGNPIGIATMVGAWFHWDRRFSFLIKNAAEEKLVASIAIFIWDFSVTPQFYTI
jgi:hypothetical protein